MSMFILKLIAIITMTIDHVGLLIFPGQIIFRIVGRLAFVLFAFLIVNGYQYTKNSTKYLLRLLFMAFFCQIPDMLQVINYGGNIFFTLSLGLSIIMLIDSHKISNYCYAFFLVLLSAIIEIDYGMYGVLIIIGFYIATRFQLNFMQQLLLFIVINIYGVQVQNFMPIQYYSLLALVIIKHYNHQRGYSSNLLNQAFYWYYPSHLLILSLIASQIY